MQTTWFRFRPFHRSSAFAMAWTNLLVVLALVPLVTLGDTCVNPRVTTDSYTTVDSATTSQTVFIIDFGVECSNGARPNNLYADLNGKTVPASRITGTDRYQVSWSDEHKKLPSGTYTVRFYDEEGYSDLRKAQRSGEDVDKVASLFSVEVVHPGASQGFWFQSEFCATAIAGLVFAFAHITRSKLQS